MMVADAERVWCYAGCDRCGRCRTGGRGGSVHVMGGRMGVLLEVWLGVGRDHRVQRVRGYI